MIRRFFFGLMMLSMALGTMAEPVVIKGVVTQGEGLFIRLRMYSDGISNLEITLASQEIGQNGRFNLVTDISKITLAYLEIDLQKGDIFIQPGETYEVMVEHEITSLMNTFYERSPLKIEFITDDKDDLNRKTGDINEIFNRVMMEDLPRAALNRETKLLPDRFSLEARQDAGTDLPEYLDQYIGFKTDQLEYMVQAKGRSSLLRDYLAPGSLPYSHVEFMQLFNLLFYKYLLSNNRYISYNTLVDLVNGGHGLGEILDTMQTDPLLSSPELCELVLLSSLKEFYQTPGFSKDNLKSLVAELVQSAIAPETRFMARNLLRKFNRLAPGSPAPEWELKSTAGLPLKLTDFKGKYLYLGFFLPGQTISDSQLDTLQDIYGEFRQKVEFVSLLSVPGHALSVTGPYEKLPWPVALLSRDPEILESYDVKTFPHFILIDPEGIIFRSPAAGPTENVRRLLEGF